MGIEEIREQLNYYFSNSNYARDNFMQEEAKNNNGIIRFESLMKFKRLKNLGATVEKIKEALKDSEFIKVEENGLRKIENEEYREYLAKTDIDKNIIYIKGFPLHYGIDEIKSLIKENGGNPERITLKKYKNGDFAGACFIEFKTEAEALEFKGKEIGINNDKEEEESKRQKKVLAIVTKEEYNTSKKYRDGQDKDKEYIEKIRKDFIPKLYHFESNKELEISGIKDIVKGSAFVDLRRKTIRMKYREEWDDNVFEKDGVSISLRRMTPEDARKYVDKLNIKRKSQKNNS